MLKKLKDVYLAKRRAAMIRYHMAEIMEELSLSTLSDKPNILVILVILVIVNGIRCLPKDTL